MLPNKKEEYFSDEESARRRDGVVRVMANTLPQPRCASHLSHPGCIKNADRSAGTGDGTIFAVRRA